MNTQKNVSQGTAAENIEYGFRRELDASFEETRGLIIKALADEGFGVLCEIDIKEKLKEKLGVDFRKYVILGACNPPIAFEALQEEIDLGLLLPCNVIVYEQDSKTIVAAVDAEKMMSVVGNENLSQTARSVNEKMQRAIGGL